MLDINNVKAKHKEKRKKHQKERQQLIFDYRRWCWGFSIPPVSPQISVSSVCWLLEIPLISLCSCQCIYLPFLPHSTQSGSSPGIRQCCSTPAPHWAVTHQHAGSIPCTQPALHTKQPIPFFISLQTLKKINVGSPLKANPRAVRAARLIYWLQFTRT